jgi:hypothetical protein
MSGGKIGGLSLEELVNVGIQHNRYKNSGGEISETHVPMVAVPVAKTQPTGLQRAATRPTKTPGGVSNEEINARLIRVERKLDWLINVLRQG